MQMIVLSGIVEGISTRKGDKSVLIKIASQEQTPEKAGKLFSLQDQYVYVALKAEPFREDEAKAIESLKTSLDDPGAISPSKRLRNVLYRLWEVDREGYTDFNLFYDFKMGQLIEHYKRKLP